MSIDGYARLMSLFFAFYRRHDAMLADACSAYSMEREGFVYESRRQILQNDLAALGVDDRALSVPETPALPPIRSRGTLGGILYVLEGSMLGGSVLSLAVARLLAPAGAAGDGYWRWCRDAGAGRWAMTCAMIEKLSRTDECRSEMVVGARLTFDIFGRSLDRWIDDRPVRQAFGSVARC